MVIERLDAFDSTADDMRKILALSATTQEAARHAVQVPDSAQEMRGLILEAIEGIGALIKARFSWPEAEGITQAHLAAVKEAQSGRLSQVVLEWWIGVLPPLSQRFFEALKKNLQISPHAVRQLEELALKELSLAEESRSVFLLETAMRCGSSDPESSARLMLMAFERFPGLLKDRAEHLKGFVYEPGAHPQVEHHQCLVCGGPGEPYHNDCACYMANYDPMFLPPKLWMRCQSCGTLYTRWFPEEFLALGQEPRLVLPREGCIAVQESNTFLLRTWNEILNLARDLSGGGGTELLEVGVGNGHLIAVAREMGYRVTAVEILEQAAQETADLLQCPILCGDFLRMPEDHTYDVITMGDVLEHLRDPLEGLKKACRLLKSGGVLWLSTPNYESAFSQMRNVKDPMWREPYHITYFSRRSLTRLVEQVGFRVARYSVSNHYNGSMELLLQK